MDLIKNRGEGKYTTCSQKFCTKCSNTGIIRVVKECDREKFDREFDRLDAPGTLEMGIIYEQVMDKCQHDCYYCTACEKGLLYKDRYPAYKR